MGETKVYYYINEDERPYLVKLNKPSNQVTLGDFKSCIPTQYQRYKFFFKSHDADFGVVKEEIIDDQVRQNTYNL